MLLVAGLGNPGPEYAQNRHNIGFLAADAITDRYSFPPLRAKFQGEVSLGQIAGQKVLVLKPSTFMNESGVSVAAAARFYRIEPESVIVLHDEIDLEAGKLRLKAGGGHAGHNGLRSIHAHLGPDYRRLRFGIGHPGDRDLVTNHVLNDFAKADRDWLVPLLDAVAGHFELLVKGDGKEFMNKVTLDTSPPSKEDKAKPEE